MMVKIKPIPGGLRQYPINVPNVYLQDQEMLRKKGCQLERQFGRREPRLDTIHKWDVVPVRDYVTAIVQILLKSWKVYALRKKVDAIHFHLARAAHLSTLQLGGFQVRIGDGFYHRDVVRVSLIADHINAVTR
jgi:hypothetical protein